MVASNEPTLPSFCVCGVNDVTVVTDAVTPYYAYTNTDMCMGTLNISLPIKGVLSDDPSAPGLLMENVDIHNRTVGSLDPNMIFHVTRDESGALDVAFTYACLGRIGLKERFSFNILARSGSYSTDEIEAMVQTVNASAAGMVAGGRGCGRRARPCNTPASTHHQRPN